MKRANSPSAHEDKKFEYQPATADEAGAPGNTPRTDNNTGDHGPVGNGAFLNRLKMD